MQHGDLAESGILWFELQDIRKYFFKKEIFIDTLIFIDIIIQISINIDMRYCFG